MNTTEARANIAAATSLNALMQALRDTRSLTSEEQDEINWTDLQTFGGDEPSSTAEVWSWDADSLLVGACADDLEIISRAQRDLWMVEQSGEPIPEGAFKTEAEALRAVDELVTNLGWDRETLSVEHYIGDKAAAYSAGL